MKLCKSCGENFKTYLKLNGKVRNLSKRSYCLTCSPYGQHNTRKITKNEPETKRCPRCNLIKSRSDFYSRRNGSGNSCYCKSCNNAECMDRLIRFKKQCLDYKGGCCTICGYSKFYGALEFHHKNPNEKDFGISNSRHRTFDDKIKAELDKCVLLCSNCHREVHGGILSI